MFPNSQLGAADMMDALIYGQSHPSTLQSLQNQFVGIGTTVMDSARAFMDRGREMFERFNGSEAMRFARNVVQQVLGTNVVNSNYIMSIFELPQFQAANLINQRWIMADPVVRDLYHRQLCDGYSGSYVDIHGAVSGNEHYDYRLVMDGMVQVEENDWKIVHYFDQLAEGDRVLMLEEKDAILHTWTHLEFLLAAGADDPTSKQGSML